MTVSFLQTSMLINVSKIISLNSPHVESHVKYALTVTQISSCSQNNEYMTRIFNMTFKHDGILVINSGILPAWKLLLLTNIYWNVPFILVGTCIYKCSGIWIMASILLSYLYNLKMFFSFNSRTTRLLCRNCSQISSYMHSHYWLCVFRSWKWSKNQNQQNSSGTFCVQAICLCCNWNKISNKIKDHGKICSTIWHPVWIKGQCSTQEIHTCSNTFVN